MIRRATSKLQNGRISKSSLTKKKISTPLRYATHIYPSAQIFTTGIGDDVSHSESSRSFLERDRDISTTFSDHDATSIDAMSFTAIDDVNGNVGENNCILYMEALGPISDFDCRTLSTHCHTPCHYHPSSQMEEGQGQGKEPSLSTETVVITAGAFLRWTAVPLHTAVAKYRCATETYGCTEVRVGTGDYIPRWRKNSVLSYFVDDESFLTPADAICIREAMQKAVCMWSGIAVPFKEVHCRGSAIFVVKYHPRECTTIYARAFFPDELPGDLLVYKSALSNNSYLANILAHELGHILGLRHEFADEDKQERNLRCVLFGKKNSRSIMNYYKDLGQLQVSEQDLQELEAFYAYNGEKYKGLPIHDYDPVLRTRISREETHSSHATRKSGRRFSYRTLLGKVDSFISETLHAVK
ncbi:hypothetical protein J3E69DRAFT_94772 [Trichoderma sp. SZMC 28015]